MKRFLVAFVRFHASAAAFLCYCGLFAGWLVGGQTTGYDPYPFGFLTLVVSLLAILLGIATLYTAAAIERWQIEHMERIETMERRILECMGGSDAAE